MESEQTLGDVPPGCPEAGGFNFCGSPAVSSLDIASLNFAFDMLHFVQKTAGDQLQVFDRLLVLGRPQQLS